MEGASALRIDCGTGHVRLRQDPRGWSVVRAESTSVDLQALSLTRWRFAPEESRAAHARFLDEALALAGRSVERLRQQAEEAIGRAYAARARMRPGSPALLGLEKRAVEAADAYLRTGQTLLNGCIEVERQVLARGHRPEDRPLPAWVTALLDALSAERKGSVQHTDDQHAQDGP